MVLSDLGLPQRGTGLPPDLGTAAATASCCDTGTLGEGGGRGAASAGLFPRVLQPSVLMTETDGGDAFYYRPVHPEHT